MDALLGTREPQQNGKPDALTSKSDTGVPADARERGVTEGDDSEHTSEDWRGKKRNAPTVGGAGGRAERRKERRC